MIVTYLLAPVPNNLFPEKGKLAAEAPLESHTFFNYQSSFLFGMAHSGKAGNGVALVFTAPGESISGIVTVCRCLKLENRSRSVADCPRVQRTWRSTTMNGLLLPLTLAILHWVFTALRWLPPSGQQKARQTMRFGGMWVPGMIISISWSTSYFLPGEKSQLVITHRPCPARSG
jgi:hypothetical protein